MKNKPGSKVGYVSANFTPETIRQLIVWSNIVIPQSQLAVIKMGGRLEGGNVSDKAHLTLFFGLDDKNIDHKELSDLIAKIKIERLRAMGVDLFPAPSSGCKILVLKIADPAGELLKTNQQLSELPNFGGLSPFVPHVTIALVKDNFDINGISLDKLPVLSVDKILYKLKKY